ncbi:E3 ubiquitin-protein ligase RNF125 [Lemmus lemmus]
MPATDIAKRIEPEYQNCTTFEVPAFLRDTRCALGICKKYMNKSGILQELGETTTHVYPLYPRELEEDSLLDHCITYHNSERRPMFCLHCHLPLSESLSNFNGSFIRHLQVSHTLFVIL